MNKINAAITAVHGEVPEKVLSNHTRNRRAAPHWRHPSRRRLVFQHL